MGGTVIEIKPENVTKYKISGLTSTDVKQYHDDKSASYVLPNDTYGILYK
jgi:hypothetical protein